MPVKNETQQGFPNVSSALVDNQGYINQAWLQLLIQLWNRTGGAEGFSSKDLALLEVFDHSRPDLEQHPLQLQLPLPSVNNSSSISQEDKLFTLALRPTPAKLSSDEDKLFALMVASNTVQAQAGIDSGRQLWQYRAKTTTTSGYPGDGYMLWNNATQTSATALIFAHITQDGLDIDLFLSFLASGQTIIIQDANNSDNNQKWTISGAPTNTGGGTSTSYWTVPVTFISSAGTGTTGFPNNHSLIAVVFGAGAGTGTVTSVALSMPAIFSVSGSPVTTSGTFTVTLANESANTVWAGPTTGAAAAPTFRSLVTNDLPSSGVTAGSYTNANITVNAQGQVTIASSGGSSGSNWIPLVTGAYEPAYLTQQPMFITDGNAQLVMVWYTP